MTLSANMSVTAAELECQRAKQELATLETTLPIGRTLQICYGMMEGVFIVHHIENNNEPNVSNLGNGLQVINYDAKSKRIEIKNLQVLDNGTVRQTTYSLDCTGIGCYQVTEKGKEEPERKVVESAHFRSAQDSHNEHLLRTKFLGLIGSFSPDTYKHSSK